MISYPQHRGLLPLALLASLGGNLFLGGFILGGPRHHGPPDPERFVERLAATLPEADAAMLRRALADNRDALVADRERHRDMPRKIEAALLAEPFDPQALARVFAETDAQEQPARRRMQQALIEVAAALSPEGRRRMAAFRP